MQKRIFPRRKVCERFYFLYELEGCQKAVDYLTRYYGIRRMYNSRWTESKKLLCYLRQKQIMFQERGLTKRTVLHELYHHIVDCYGLEMIRTEEERNAVYYAKSVLEKARNAISG